MFDVGFLELAMIGVVALVVIGPERLPGVARSVGKWVGSARRFVRSVQADINLEVSKADELKRLLEEQTQIKSVHEIIEQAEPQERKPVPRSVASSEYAPKQQAAENNEADSGNKPDYLVKAIPDEPASNDADNASNGSAEKASQSSKHD